MLRSAIALCLFGWLPILSGQAIPGTYTFDHASGLLDWDSAEELGIIASINCSGGVTATAGGGTIKAQFNATCTYQSPAGSSFSHSNAGTITLTLPNPTVPIDANYITPNSFLVTATYQLTTPRPLQSFIDFQRPADNDQGGSGASLTNCGARVGSTAGPVTSSCAIRELYFKKGGVLTGGTPYAYGVRVGVSNYPVPGFAYFDVLANYSNPQATNPDIKIDQMEFVQSVQLADHSVRMVQGKDTMLRIFPLLNTPNAQPLAGVSATVTDLDTGKQSRPLPPVTVNTSYSRANLRDSLNYVLDPSMTVGSHSFLVTLVYPPGLTDPGGPFRTFTVSKNFQSNLHTSTVTWIPMCVKFSFISTGPVCPGGTTSPSDYISLASKLFPYPNGSLTSIPLAVTPFALTWLDDAVNPETTFELRLARVLLQVKQLLNYKAVAGNHLVAWLPPIGSPALVWSGKLPVGSPEQVANDVSFLPDLSVANGVRVGPRTTNKVEPVLAPLSELFLAYRLGLQLGLTADSLGMLGENDVGVDISRRLTYTSAARDVMSTRTSLNLIDPHWISSSNYGALFSSLVGATSAHAPEPEVSPQATAQEYAIITGTIQQDNSPAQIDPILRVTSTAPPPVLSTTGAYCVQAANASATLASTCFDIAFTPDETGAIPSAGAFGATLPWPAGATQVRLVKGANQLAALTGSGNPTVTITSPHQGDVWSPGTHTIAWTVGGGAIASTVLYSYDGGVNWLPLTVNTTDTQYTLDPKPLFGGSQVLFQVMVSDGINTASATVGPMTITQTPAIQAPASVDFGSVTIGQTVDLKIPVSNSGSGRLTLQSLATSDPAFTILSPATPVDLPGGTGISVTVRYTAGANGPLNGTLTIQSNDPSHATTSVALAARGSSSPVPSLGPPPSTLDFGNVGVGQTSDFTLTLNDNGAADLNLTNGAITGPFQIVSGATPVTVPAYTSKSLTLRFAPAAMGPASGTYSVATNDPSHPTLSIALSGTGVTACSYSLNSTSSNVGASATSGSLSLSAGPSCGWSAFSNVSWFTITSPSTGSGATTINYSVTANNTGATRTGALFAGDQQFTLTQTSGSAPVLSITLSHTPSTFAQGQTGSYTMTVSNTGQAATTGAVSVSDTLPTGLTATGITGTGWSCTAPSGPCTRSDSLAAGGAYPTLTLAVNVAANASASVTTSATVSGGGSANATITDPTTINPASAAPVLSIGKSHSGTFTQGQQGALYTVTVANAGPGATSGTVTVTENPPAGLTLASMSGTGWICSAAACTRSDSLAAGQSYPAITVTVNVTATAAAAVTNSVTVSGGGDPNSHSATDATTIRPSTGVFRTLVYHEITSLTSSTMYASNYGPVLSKNGNRAVFTTGFGLPFQIFVVNADGNTAPVMVDSYNHLCDCNAEIFITDDGSAVASSDFRQIRYALADGSGGHNVVTSDSSLAAMRLLSNRIYFLQNADGHLNGTLATEGLYAVNVDGTALQQLVTAANLQAALGTTAETRFGDGGQPVVESSADGSRIVFSALVFGTGTYLMAVNSNGQGLHKLIGPYGGTYSAAMSADGATVFYNLQPFGSVPAEAGVINFDGTGQRVLVTGLDAYSRTAQISADGSQVILENGGRVYRTDGSGFYTLAINSPAAAQPPVIGSFNASMNSTATRFLYLTADANGVRQLATIDLNPANPGSAPTLDNVAVTPGYVVVSGGSSATFSAHATGGNSLLGVSGAVMKEGVVDGNTGGQALYDDGSNGDATAGDHVFTNNQIRADCCATIGPRTVRIQAEARVGATGSRRHATAVDFTPFSVVSVAPVCVYSISPSSATLPSGAGAFTPLTGSFTLTATNCSAANTWTAVSDAPSRLVVNASGNGATASATINYSMFTNSTTQSRVTHISVGGQTFTVTQAGTNETQGQRVVRALYQSILGREPDSGGFAFWTGSGAPRNNSGAVLYNQMADGFYVSPEFKNSGWLALNIYQAVNGSLPAIAQWQTSVTQIRNQTLTPTQLTNNLAGSMTNQAFVQAAYVNGFGRQPNSAELSSSVTSLNAGLSKFDFLNTVIFPSGEFTSRTNGALVQALFFTILVRDPDSGGFNFWLGQLNPPNGQTGIYYLYNPQPVTPAYTFKLAVIGQAVPPNPNLLGFLGSPEFQGLIQ